MTGKQSANMIEMKVSINVISIVLAYILLYVPSPVMAIILTYFPWIILREEASKGLDIFNIYCTIAKILNCIVDAFVFVCVNKQFRSVLRQMLRCKCRHK